MYVEQLPVPLFYPRISDNANGPTSGRVVELIKRRGKPNSIEVVDNFSLSCFAIIFQQNFYRNALINMMIFAFFKQCRVRRVHLWTYFKVDDFPYGINVLLGKTLLTVSLVCQWILEFYSCLPYGVSSAWVQIIRYTWIWIWNVPLEIEFFEVNGKWTMQGFFQLRDLYQKPIF